MKSLVGYSGFVGSNLAIKGDFDCFYDSKNIKEAFGTEPDLLVYAGVPAQKFLANQFPEKDMEVINNAINNIKEINPKKIVLISTIDVYKNPVDVSEETQIVVGENEPYGENRHVLENWVMNNFDDYLVVRLPALYGKNLKKNFIYDFIHVIPSMLKEEKFKELCDKNDFIKDYYTKQDNGFYKLNEINNNEEVQLKEYFNNIGFSALNFTDTRGSFQFYNLAYLWEHINIALDNNIKLLNLATEPVLVSEVYQYITGKNFVNECSNKIPKYDYKSIHADLFGGSNGYIFKKDFILKDIKEYVENSVFYNLSISNIAWGEEKDNEMYKYISSLGFRGLEIAPTRIIKENPYDKLDDIEKFADKLYKNYGLTIPSMQSIWYGRKENIFTSAEDRKALLEYTKKAMDFASRINCKNLVFGCPKNRNIPDTLDKNEARKIAIEFFKELGEYAKDKNVVLAIEPNPPIYNTNFINTTEEAFDIVKEINCDNVKVNVDLGTIIENKEDINMLKDNIKYINHVHISEPNLEVIQKRDMHKDLIKILRENNYSNFVSIEMKNTNNIDDVHETLDYVRRLFK